ncbi:MAG: ThuA domain-containing protein [Phototrophicaceae bacterium]
MLRITIWNEFRHEKVHPDVQAVYPDGIHAVIAEALRHDESLSVRVATLDEPEHGLTDEVLEQTDVLMWWGHMAHDEVQDDIVNRVHQRVLGGMGLVVLHSGHFSKVFKKLMGTTCDLHWREAGELERIWTVNPAHPIAQGLPPFFEIPQAEMYGEYFDVPEPDSLVFISWFEGGEVFRSGLCYHRGQGKIFYFRPGHETYPIYYHAHVQHVLRNAVHWCAPTTNPALQFGHVPQFTHQKGEA